MALLHAAWHGSRRRGGSAGGRGCTREGIGRPESLDEVGERRESRGPAVGSDGPGHRRLRKAEGGGGRRRAAALRRGGPPPGFAGAASGGALDRAGPAARGALRGCGAQDSCAQDPRAPARGSRGQHVASRPRARVRGPHAARRPPRPGMLAGGSVPETDAEPKMPRRRSHAGAAGLRRPVRRPACASPAVGGRAPRRIRLPLVSGAASPPTPCPCRAWRLGRRRGSAIWSEGGGGRGRSVGADAAPTGMPGRRRGAGADARA